MSRVAKVNAIDDGYELQLTGDPIETRALAETFIRQEATCCSFLHFDLAETAEGLRLRLTGSPAAMVFAQDIGIGRPEE